MIKFYILVPVYKTEVYICQCAESVLNQTYPHFEAILVDDGSPDRAGEICDEYAKKDNRIHVIHKENGGQLSARMAGISYVKKNFPQDNACFLFLDSDDYFREDALEVIARELEAKQCDLLFFGVQRVCQGKVIGPLGKDEYTGQITDKRELYKRVFSDMQYNSLCRKAIRCHLLRDEDWSRYYHIRHGEDLLQSISVYKDCQKAAFIGDVLYNYTVNPNSITQSITIDSFNLDMTVRREVYGFLQKENVFSTQDMAKYLTKCSTFLRMSVLSLDSFPGEKPRKKAILKEIRRDSYNAMLLEHARWDILLALLKKERYGLLLGCIRLRNALAKVYGAVRKQR